MKSILLLSLYLKYFGLEIKLKRDIVLSLAVFIIRINIELLRISGPCIDN